MRWPRLLVASRLLVLAGCCLSAAGARADDDARDGKTILTAGLGVSFGKLVGADRTRLADAGVGGVETPIGMMLFATAWDYLVVEMGGSAADAEDRRPFGSPFGDSAVSGLHGWIEGGPQLPLRLRVGGGKLIVLTPALSIGYQGLSLIREVDSCVNCLRERLDLGIGGYASASMKVAWSALYPSYAVSTGIKVAYDRYFAGDFESALWLRAFIDVGWLRETRK